MDVLQTLVLPLVGDFPLEQMRDETLLSALNQGIKIYNQWVSPDMVIKFPLRDN